MVADRAGSGRRNGLINPLRAIPHQSVILGDNRPHGHIRQLRQLRRLRTHRHPIGAVPRHRLISRQNGVRVALRRIGKHPRLTVPEHHLIRVPRERPRRSLPHNPRRALRRRRRRNIHNVLHRRLTRQTRRQPRQLRINIGDGIHRHIHPIGAIPHQGVTRRRGRDQNLRHKRRRRRHHPPLRRVIPRQHIPGRQRPTNSTRRRRHIRQILQPVRRNLPLRLRQRPRQRVTVTSRGDPRLPHRQHSIPRQQLARSGPVGQRGRRSTNRNPTQLVRVHRTRITQPQNVLVLRDRQLHRIVGRQITLSEEHLDARTGRNTIRVKPLVGLHNGFRHQNRHL